MTARVWFNGVGAIFAGLLFFGCSPTAKEDGDSQTNWLESCGEDSKCPTGKKCLCGVCTLACSLPSTCSKLQQASCVGAKEAGAIAQCGGSLPPAPGLCLPLCSVDSDCSR